MADGGLGHGFKIGLLLPALYPVRKFRCGYRNTAKELSQCNMVLVTEEAELCIIFDFG